MRTGFFLKNHPAINLIMILRKNTGYRILLKNEPDCVLGLISELRSPSGLLHTGRDWEVAFFVRPLHIEDAVLVRPGSGLNVKVFFLLSGFKVSFYCYVPFERRVLLGSSYIP